MGFFQELFARQPSLDDLKAKLREVDRDRKRAMLELRKLSSRQADLIERIKSNRKRGNNLEVDYLWEDLKALKTEVAMVRKDARILNLEGISLKRYVRGLERLDRHGDRETAKKLLERIKNSGLDRKLAMADINDRDYLRELQATLEDVGLGESIYDDLEDDPEKLEFLAQIDEIVAAEEAGNIDSALEKETRLRSHMAEGDLPREEPEDEDEGEGEGKELAEGD